jgi:hypothetical protein
MTTTIASENLHHQRRDFRAFAPGHESTLE